MNDLGKCLVFHLKYLPEMQRLLGSPEPPPDLDDGKQVQEMVQKVSLQSSQEAVELLLACQKIIEKHFNDIANCKPRSKAGHLMRGWSLTCDVWPKGKKRPSAGNWRIRVGVDILRDRNEIIPWIRRQGRKQAEQRLFEKLDHRQKGRAEEFGGYSGTVALARVQVVPDQHEGFNIPAEPLLGQVRDAFQSIKAQDIVEIYDWKV
jgi:hypothetical protein